MKDDQRKDFLYNLKFWSAVFCAGLLIWLLLEVSL
jgi:hypothetical protein